MSHHSSRRFRLRARGVDGVRGQRRRVSVRSGAGLAVECRDRPGLAAAAEASVATGKPARRFKDFKYRTLGSWSRERRVIGKAEWMTPSVAEAADTTQRRKKKRAKKARKAKADAPPPILL